MSKFKKGDIVTTVDAHAKGRTYTYEKYVEGVPFPHKVRRNDGLDTAFGKRAELYLMDIPVSENNDEMVAHPNHYGGDTTYEVIKVIEAWELDEDAYLFNTIKYVARAKKKGKQLEDLEKAAFYLNRRIEQLKGQ